MQREALATVMATVDPRGPEEVLEQAALHLESLGTDRDRLTAALLRAFKEPYYRLWKHDREDEAEAIDGFQEAMNLAGYICPANHS